MTVQTAQPGDVIGAARSDSAAIGSDTDCAGLDLMAVRRDVLDWGAPRRRALPWRATRDPWGILVSEVMLQQTQVSRVLERWQRFMTSFPTPAACAAAPLSEVLTEWQGLGYPRRARYLHLAARSISDTGHVPRDLDALLALPGVGPYTARAVLAFAFEADVAVVDTNIARTLARVSGRAMSSSELQRLADLLVPSGQGWAWNQTLMDIGAVNCRPLPNCADCPLASHCVWRSDPMTPDPAKRTAHVSKPQARFEGSDRQARGRLLAALTSGPVRTADVPSIMDRPTSTARRLMSDLIGERLCSKVGDSLVLGDEA